MIKIVFPVIVETHERGSYGFGIWDSGAWL